MHLRSLAVLLAAGALPAQGYFVTPEGYASREGANNNIYPWGLTQARYQQIHTDLPQRTIVMFGLAWRRNGASGSATSGTRDLELTIAESSYAGRSTTFASNYVANQQVVVARKMVNIADWSQQNGLQPGPFVFHVPFDAPAAFDGTKDFLWEAVQHGATATAGAADAHRVSAPTGNAAVAQVAGNGCRTNASATATMRLDGDLLVDAAWNAALSYVCYYTPTGAASNVLLLGLTNPNTSLPGLCTMLHSDGLLTVAAPTSTSAGSWASPVLQFQAWPGLVGLSLWAQAASADTTQPGIPVALSNGLGLTLPPAGNGGTLCRVYHTSNAMAATGSNTDDYGLVTQIRML